jgi:NAD-dependent SIR2 family protein deacetylase
MANEIKRAAAAIHKSRAIMFCAGAGMGVDSGLPDFRGNEGFWNAYPPFKELGLSFYDLADPKWFDENPRQAWGFYGHRFNLYNATQPHEGFEIMRRWAKGKSDNYFVFTSNVDGHFQKSGFANERVVECHGSFSHLQCEKPCDRHTWPADDLEIIVNEETMLAEESLPSCLECGAMARPNILMFGDMTWISARRDKIVDGYASWLANVPRTDMVIVEVGAGTAVPSVRRQSEQVAQSKYAQLIRINIRESQGPDGTISIAEPGLAAIRAIDSALGSLN